MFPIVSLVVGQNSALSSTPVHFSFTSHTTLSKVVLSLFTWRTCTSQCNWGCFQTGCINTIIPWRTEPVVVRLRSVVHSASEINSISAQGFSFATVIILTLKPLLPLL